MNSTHNILILFLATVFACSCAKTESDSQTVRPVSVRTITLDVNKESGTRTYIGEVEAAMAMPLYHSLGGELTALPYGGEGSESVVVRAEKRAATPANYPRRVGIPHKRPIMEK